MDVGNRFMKSESPVALGLVPVEKGNFDDRLDGHAP